MKVDINGNELKFGFGIYFLGCAQKKFKTDLEGLLQGLANNPISDGMDLMWYSAECEAHLDGVEVPIKKREFIEHLEQTGDLKNENGLLANWMKKLMETVRGNFLPETAPEKKVEAKKK